MPKMRFVKPDTWTDEKFVELSPFARLLFIGMWNFACDNGHLDDSPKQLRMRVLPADDVDPVALLDELIESGLVQRRDGYIKIANLSAHQRPDLRFLVFCEHCAHDDDATYAPSDKRARSTSARGAHDEGSTSARRNGDSDSDSDSDSEGVVAPHTRGTRLPSGFAVTDQHREWATKNNLGHLNLDAITDEFIDYWISTPGAKGRKVNWDATWRNWIRREANDTAKVRHLRSAPAPSGTSVFDKPFRDASELEAGE